MSDIPRGGNLSDFIPTVRGKMDKKNISEIRKKPGESNAGKYHTKGPYAGPDKTFPINTEKRARAALSYAHNATNPAAIKSKVYKEYPGLAKRANGRSK